MSEILNGRKFERVEVKRAVLGSLQIERLVPGRFNGDRVEFHNNGKLVVIQHDSSGGPRIRILARNERRSSRLITGSTKQALAKAA